jgi:hypothetical protein
MNKFYLEKSNRKDKKYMVSYLNPETGRVATIHFGAKGMSDFTIHKDEERKRLYLIRHQKNEDWDDIKKAGTWARFLLWGEKTLEASVKEMEKKFNIKIELILL